MLSKKGVRLFIRGIFVGLPVWYFAGFAILLLVYLVGTPFKYDADNSGRYLTVVLKELDPDLFPDDAVVEAFGLFKSGFYIALSWISETLRFPASSLAVLMEVGFYAARTGLFLTLVAVTWNLERDVWLSLMVCVWAAFQQAAPVGGDTLFKPAFTHNEVAFILILIALLCLVKKKVVAFGFVTGIAVVIHSLVGIHFFITVFPVLSLDALRQPKEIRVSLFSSALVFLFFATFYAAIMAPPAFSPTEASLFLEKKGSINHISFLNQEILGWVRLVGWAGCAWVFSQIYLADTPWASKLIKMAAWGTSSGLVLSGLAVYFKLYRIAQIQPMRIFTVVTFFLGILIAWSAARAWKKDPLIGVILFSILVFEFFGTVWAVVLPFFSYAYWVNRNILSKWTHFSHLNANIFAKAFALLFLVAMVFGWIIHQKTPFESLADPAPIIFFAMALGGGLFFSDRFDFQKVVASFAVLYALSAGILIHYQTPKEVQEQSWDDVRYWVQERTNKGDRFITAVTEQTNFRTAALRISLNESQSALYWVSPTTAMENERMAAIVQEAFEDDRWSLDKLNTIAFQYQAEYILLEGNMSSFAGTQMPVFENADYTVFRVEDQNDAR